jgi:hypothetical protein
VSETSEKQGKRVPAIFYRTEAGDEPVREWLKGLSPVDRKRIGDRQEGPNGPATWIHQENAEDTARGFGFGEKQQS